MSNNEPAPNENSRGVAIRIVILSGISMLSASVLIPLMMLPLIQPPPVVYLLSVAALLLLVVIQFGIQRMRYRMDVRVRRIDASFIRYLKYSLPRVVFYDFIVVTMFIGMILIPLIEETPFIFLLFANGLFVMALLLVIISLKTASRLPKGFQLIERDEYPHIWKVLDASNVRFRAAGFLDYKGLKVVNAYQWGTGDNSVIALSDELVQILSEEEMAAVAAHELGHVHYGHFAKLLVASIVSPLLLVNLAVAYLALDFGLTFTDIQSALYLLLLFCLALGPPILLIPWLTRRWETAADLFSASLVGTGVITSALSKMVKHNIVYANISKRLEFLISHPILETRLKRLSHLEDSSSE